MTKTILAILATLSLVAACETMHGLGQDTSKLGNDISGAVSRNSN